MASLKDKYCIVGVGETEYSRHSGRSTRAMAVEAVRNAMRDAGLDKTGVDGIMSYQSGDSTFGNFVAPDLGIRLDRKSTRLNSSHVEISYAVFCLKKKTKKKYT